MSRATDPKDDTLDAVRRFLDHGVEALSPSDVDMLAALGTRCAALPALAGTDLPRDATEFADGAVLCIFRIADGTLERFEGLSGPGTDAVTLGQALDALGEAQNLDEIGSVQVGVLYPEICQLEWVDTTVELAAVIRPLLLLPAENQPVGA